MEEILKAFEIFDYKKLDENQYLIERWNWEYGNCTLFQKQVQKLVQKNRKLKVYIFTSHPHVFTMGRGNERGEEGLVEFKEEETQKLPYPLHYIHRGGGITFHYPGQWIFYPIVSINENYSLNDHICWLLSSVRDELVSTFKLEGVLAATRLVGVWKDRQKLASIGVGVDRFVTEHGLALNLCDDKEMFENLHVVSPCGMNPATYRTVESFLSSKAGDMRSLFHSNYLKNNILAK